jgi:RNA polymerase sigma-70 factor (ECF subfamily)
MTPDETDSHLSHIRTHWSLVCKAHSGKSAEASTAQLRLLQSYGGAIQRYLLAATRDPEAAEELAQEFALRFIRGDFHGADPGKGRFRDYVKTVLIRLVAGYHRRKYAAPGPLPADAAEPATPSPSDDAEFLASWRRDLLDRTWAALEALENDTGQPYHTVLKRRVDEAGEGPTSAQMAAELTTSAGRPFTAEGVRKVLQRAREKFARLLVEEVRQSLDDPTPEQLEQELRDLGLWGYCQV